MRMLDREQAKMVAGFGSTTRANTRLLALFQAGLLRRCFLGTTAGASKALYMLSAKGAEAVGVTLHGRQRRNNEALVASFSIEHQLQINAMYCALKFQPIPVLGARFSRWKTFLNPVSPSLPLVPDGYVELETPSGPLAAFLEVDLGTENLTVWKEKIDRYLQLAVSGEFERLFRQSRFRVLVTAHSERRMHSIRKVVAAATDKIFWLTSLESINRQGFFAPIWFRPKDDTPKPFIPLEPHP